MTLRRVMLVVTIVLLVLFAALVGTVAADWPYLRRVIAATGMTEAGDWPGAFPAPMARIDGGRIDGEDSAAVDPVEAAAAIDPAALDAAARWAAANATQALLVLHRGRLVLERYGDGADVDTAFQGQGLSGSLVGLAYGAAIERGLLSLDDPAAKWLEEWRDDPRGDITLRQLLQNISGLEEFQGLPRTSPAAGPFGRIAAIVRAWADRRVRFALGIDFGAAALTFDLAHAPGTHFALNGVNPQLLGLILERATGTPFERWFAQQVWAPLQAGVGEFYLDRASGRPALHCCFRAVAHDWLRLGALLAGNGAIDGRQVLPPGWVGQLATTTSNVNPRYGLQVWSGRALRGLREYRQGSGIGVRHGEDFLTDDVVWMEGDGGRSIWAFPSRQLVILRFGRDLPGWDGSALPNILLRGLQAEVITPR
ncbi:MAG: serine hydrolase [Sinobacteraceae bacterium]|nr:serine hydrolase [Nevskiaceae bacterium]